MYKELTIENIKTFEKEQKLKSALTFIFQQPPYLRSLILVNLLLNT